jgi:hypothetical protein
VIVYCVDTLRVDVAFDERLAIDAGSLRAGSIT